MPQKEKQNTDKKMVETNESYYNATALLERAALERVDLSKTDTNLYNYQVQIDRAIEVKGGIDDQIIIPDAINNRISNLYALLSIFDSAESEITIYTTKLEDTLYSRDDVISYIRRWLNIDESRKLTILLKEEPDTKTDYFFNIFPLLNNEKQLDVRISTVKEARDCNVNGVIADERIYKIKETNLGTGKENIALNYNDPKTVKKLIPAYSILISDEFSKPIQRKQKGILSFTRGNDTKNPIIDGEVKVISAVDDIKNTVSNLLAAA